MEAPRIGKPGLTGTPIGIEDEDGTGKNGFGVVSETIYRSRYFATERSTVLHGFR